MVETAAIQVIATGRNAHAILADRTNTFVYVPTLGANQILQFLFDAKTGNLTPNEPAAVMARPGDGPRHLAFSLSNEHLYVLNELTGNITSSPSTEKGHSDGGGQRRLGASRCRSDSGCPSSARWTSCSSGSEGRQAEVWAADIQLIPNGKFLYSTERTLSKIALFSVAPGSGRLTYVTNFSTEKQPRGIKIDPSGTYLVASGEKSDRLAVYKIDPSNGQLTEIGRYPVGSGANWVEIVEIP